MLTRRFLAGRLQTLRLCCKGAVQTRWVVTGAEITRILRKQHICSTLIPEKLLPSDYIDISNYKAPSVAWASNPETALLPVYRWESSRTSRFPADTRGFFYYGPRPGLPPIASSLRFRCTPSSDPASFKDGHDLLLPTGLPWQIITAQIANPGPTYLSVRTELFRSGLLTEHALKEWRRCFGPPKPAAFWRLPMNSIILFSLDQLFPVDFQSHLHLQILTPGMRRPYLLRSYRFFAWHPWNLELKMQPFFGTALARLELSPTQPHLLHLRIAKIISPVGLTPQAEASGLVWRDEDGNLAGVPREGELFEVLRVRGGKRIEPWAMDLRDDSRDSTALRMLAFGRDWREVGFGVDPSRSELEQDQ
ncbi:hypothetical protein FB45DRAFT_47476 [Roridomyces roridus]|uniref:Uncharacterized protein n=1 Tax=Roridomyces roridus TaxID=1738132 RepID=A0AAD7BSD2_9AGAR|nr:hypothetical protein FB45DRAFT_47476 [Roridomyces roridus]